MDADSLYWIGNIRAAAEQERGGARPPIRGPRKIQPLISRQAIESPPDFRVLALDAPFAGNIPTEFLFKHVNYDSDTLALFGSDVGAARRPYQDIPIVVNLVSDADQADAVLPLVVDLVQRLDKPAVNIPGGSRVPRAMRRPIRCRVLRVAVYRRSCA